MAAAISTAAPTKRSFTGRSTARSIKGFAASEARKLTSETQLLACNHSSAGPTVRNEPNTTMRSPRAPSPAQFRIRTTRRPRSRRQSRPLSSVAATTHRRGTARALSKPDDDPGVECSAQSARDTFDVFVAENAADGDGSSARRSRRELPGKRLRGGGIVRDIQNPFDHDRLRSPQRPGSGRATSRSSGPARLRRASGAVAPTSIPARTALQRRCRTAIRRSSAGRGRSS